MKAKNLRVLKKDILVFKINSTIDKANANTYKCFSSAYIIREAFKLNYSTGNYEKKMIRIYFSELKPKGWNPYKKFYSYANCYDIVKDWLNDNSNLNIKYMSDFQNIVCYENEYPQKDFNNIIKHS